MLSIDIHFSENISDARRTICDQYLIWGNKLPLFVFRLWGNVYALWQQRESIHQAMKQRSGEEGRAWKEEAFGSGCCYPLRPGRCWRACILLLGRRRRWGASAEIISSLCQKATRRIGYLRKGISPLCKLWIKHCNTRGCHTLVPLTFLYLTVKNSFSHLFSALVSAITMFQSRLVPTVTHNTQKDRSLSSCAAITSPISLKQKSLV